MSQTKAQLIDPVDGTIVNADINASAAIAGSKISPSFTSDITITNATPSIDLVDSDNNSDFKIQNANGLFLVYDTTNSASRLTIASDGTLDVNGNLDANQGIDVTGNASISGGDITVTAGEGASALINLIADQGDDNGDGWKIQSEQDENDLTFKSNVSGSYVDKLKLKSSGQLEVQGALITTGDATISGGDLTVTGTNPIVHLTDTNDNSDYQLNVNGGVFQVYDYTNSSGRFLIASDGDATFQSTTGNAVFTFKKSDAPSGEETVTVRFDRNGTVIGGVGGPSQITGASGNDIGLAATNNGSIRFGIGTGGIASTKVSIDSTGDMYIADGDLVISTAGHGIDFSAQTATSASGATTGAEILDHYEEGSWTPALNTGNTADSSGSYTRIGRMVYAAFNIDISSNSSTTHATITGLPFAAENVNPNANGTAPDYQTYDVEDGPIYHIGKTQTQIVLYKNNGAALQAQNISGKNLRGTAIYRTD